MYRHYSTHTRRDAFIVHPRTPPPPSLKRRAAKEGTGPARFRRFAPRGRVQPFASLRATPDPTPLASSSRQPLSGYDLGHSGRGRAFAPPLCLLSATPSGVRLGAGDPKGCAFGVPCAQSLSPRLRADTRRWATGLAGVLGLTACGSAPAPCARDELPMAVL